MKENDAQERPLNSTLLLTGEDVAFIHRVFGEDLVSFDDLQNILDHPQLRQQVLDCRCLFHAATDNDEDLRISPFFYYLIIARQALLEAALEDPRHAEKVAQSLVHMAHLHGKHLGLPTGSPLYFPVRMDIVTREQPEGTHVTIAAYLDDYRMVMDGFLESGFCEPPVPETKK